MRAARDGGRRSNHGYSCVKVHGHSRADVNGYVREHLLIAERALGRPIEPKHPVHHVDENRANNQPSNLVLCENQQYHFLLHRRARAFAACGDPSARPCVICGGYDRQEDMSLKANGYGGTARHRDCHAAYERNRNQNKRA